MVRFGCPPAWLALVVVRTDSICPAAPALGRRRPGDAEAEESDRERVSEQSRKHIYPKHLWVGMDARGALRLLERAVAGAGRGLGGARPGRRGLIGGGQRLAAGALGARLDVLLGRLANPGLALLGLDPDAL